MDYCSGYVDFLAKGYHLLQEKENLSMDTRKRRLVSPIKRQSGKNTPVINRIYFSELNACQVFMVDTMHQQ